MAGDSKIDKLISKDVAHITSRGVLYNTARQVVTQPRMPQAAAPGSDGVVGHAHQTLAGSGFWKPNQLRI